MHKRNQALKIVWLFRTDQFVSNQVQSIPPSDLGTWFWKCNLHPSDLPLPLINANPFWKQVTIHWFDLKWMCENNPTELVKISHQIIWLNSHIQIEGNVVYYVQLVKNGCLFLHQLFEGSIFKTVMELNEEFHTSLSCFEHYSLCKAVPSSWVKCIKDSNLVVSVPLVICMIKSMRQRRKPSLYMTSWSPGH